MRHVASKEALLKSDAQNGATTVFLNKCPGEEESEKRHLELETFKGCVSADINLAKEICSGLNRREGASVLQIHGLNTYPKSLLIQKHNAFHLRKYLFTSFKIQFDRRFTCDPRQDASGADP